MELRPYPTVVHMLRETAARWPEREAVVCGDERLNYANYLDAIATFAGELVSLGARGERVALVLGNGPDICVAIFATHAAGAQAVPLNPLYTSRELGMILRMPSRELWSARFPSSQRSSRFSRVAGTRM